MVIRSATVKTKNQQQFKWICEWCVHKFDCHLFSIKQLSSASLKYLFPPWDISSDWSCLIIIIVYLKSIIISKTFECPKLIWSLFPPIPLSTIIFKSGGYCSYLIQYSEYNLFMLIVQCFIKYLINSNRCFGFFWIELKLFIRSDKAINDPETDKTNGQKKWKLRRNFIKRNKSSHSKSKVLSAVSKGYVFDKKMYSSTLVSANRSSMTLKLFINIIMYAFISSHVPWTMDHSIEKRLKTPKWD